MAQASLPANPISTGRQGCLPHSSLRPKAALKAALKEEASREAVRKLTVPLSSTILLPLRRLWSEGSALRPLRGGALPRIVWQIG